MRTVGPDAVAFDLAADDAGALPVPDLFVRSLYCKSKDS